VVSIFEPHTDIIRKDRRETLYGHKVFLTGGASGMIVDCFVERGNPADSTKAVKLAHRAIKVLGNKPEQIVFDGGFTSRDNLEQIKALGIRDVAFSKASGLSIKEMVRRTWLYQGLRNFRAGIEGVISFLKRCFGWDRCAWRSYVTTGLAGDHFHRNHRGPGDQGDRGQGIGPGTRGDRGPRRGSGSGGAVGSAPIILTVGWKE
jgi:transposase, IS5 family